MKTIMRVIPIIQFLENLSIKNKFQGDNITKIVVLIGRSNFTIRNASCSHSWSY